MILRHKFWRPGLLPRPPGPHRFPRAAAVTRFVHLSAGLKPQGSRKPKKPPKPESEELSSQEFFLTTADEQLSSTNTTSTPLKPVPLLKATKNELVALRNKVMDSITAIVTSQDTFSLPPHVLRATRHLSTHKERVEFLLKPGNHVQIPLKTLYQYYRWTSKTVSEEGPDVSSAAREAMIAKLLAHLMYEEAVVVIMELGTFADILLRFDQQILPWLRENDIYAVGFYDFVCRFLRYSDPRVLQQLLSEVTWEDLPSSGVFGSLGVPDNGEYAENGDPITTEEAEDPIYSTVLHAQALNRIAQTGTYAALSAEVSAFTAPCADPISELFRTTPIGLGTEKLLALRVHVLQQLMALGEFSAVARCTAQLAVDPASARMLGPGNLLVRLARVRLASQAESGSNPALARQKTQVLYEMASQLSLPLSRLDQMGLAELFDLGALYGITQGDPARLAAIFASAPVGAARRLILRALGERNPQLLQYTLQVAPEVPTRVAAALLNEEVATTVSAFLSRIRWRSQRRTGKAGAQSAGRTPAEAENSLKNSSEGPENRENPENSEVSDTGEISESSAAISNLCLESHSDLLETSMLSAFLAGLPAAQRVSAVAAATSALAGAGSIGKATLWTLLYAVERTPEVPQIPRVLADQLTSHLRLFTPMERLRLLQMRKLSVWQISSLLETEARHYVWLLHKEEAERLEKGIYSTESDDSMAQNSWALDSSSKILVAGLKVIWDASVTTASTRSATEAPSAGTGGSETETSEAPTSAARNSLKNIQRVLAALAADQKPSGLFLRSLADPGLPQDACADGFSELEVPDTPPVRAGGSDGLGSLWPVYEFAVLLPNHEAVGSVLALTVQELVDDLSVMSAYRLLTRVPQNVPHLPPLYRRLVVVCATYYPKLARQMAGRIIGLCPAFTDPWEQTKMVEAVLTGFSRSAHLNSNQFVLRARELLWRCRMQNIPVTARMGAAIVDGVMMRSKQRSQGSRTRLRWALETARRLRVPEARFMEWYYSIKHMKESGIGVFSSAVRQRALRRRGVF